MAIDSHDTRIYLSASALQHQEDFARQVQEEFSALSSLVSSQLDPLTTQQQQQSTAARDWAASLSSSVQKVKVSLCGRLQIADVFTCVLIIMVLW